MIEFSLEHQPGVMNEYRKTATVNMVLISIPFSVETQEGMMKISKDTVDDWDDGYYVAYPGDGSKPYAISPKFVKDNYTLID